MDICRWMNVCLRGWMVEYRMEICNYLCFQGYGSVMDMNWIWTHQTYHHHYTIISYRCLCDFEKRSTIKDLFYAEDVGVWVVEVMK